MVELQTLYLKRMERGNKVTIYILTLIVLFISGCNDPFMKRTSDWRKDKDGCLSLRSKEYFEELADDVYGMESEELKKYLGHPNKVVDNDNLNYFYYFKSYCLNNQFVDSLDHNIVLLKIDKGSNELISHEYMFP